MHSFDSTEFYVGGLSYSVEDGLDNKDDSSLFNSLIFTSDFNGPDFRTIFSWSDILIDGVTGKSHLYGIPRL